MSIAWINFAAGCVVDILKSFGFITTIKQALLNLSVLAWGNCLGDMSADVAMAKKGFGEMAITALIAGPIFNILAGSGLSSLKQLILLQSYDKKTREAYPITFSIDDKGSIVSVILIFSTLLVLTINLLNGLLNNYTLKFRFTILTMIIYVVSLIVMFVYEILYDDE